MDNLNLKTEFGVKITLYKGFHPDSVVYYRRGLSIEFALRWRWFFEYLAARVKIAHPRDRVEIFCGRLELLTPEVYIDKKRESLLRAKRGQIKRMENTPDELDLFDIAINKKRAKIDRIEDEIRRLEAGEVTFWVYDSYINRIHEFI